MTSEEKVDNEEKTEVDEQSLTNLGPAQQLFHYARSGNVNACRDVLKNNMSLVNEVDDGSTGGYHCHNTALHFACECGQLAIVELLHSQQANIEAQNKFKSTPLHIAASHGYEDIVRFLLKNEANINAKNIIENTPLHCAVYGGHIACVDALLDKVDDMRAALTNPNGVGVTPAKYAASNEMKEFLKKKLGSSYKKPNEDIPDEQKEERL